MLIRYIKACSLQYLKNIYLPGVLSILVVFVFKKPQNLNEMLDETTKDTNMKNRIKTVCAQNFQGNNAKYISAS